MACRVKIKGKEEFKVFDTEADAREYLKDTNVVIEEMINPVTKESELYDEISKICNILLSRAYAIDTFFVFSVD